MDIYIYSKFYGFWIMVTLFKSLNSNPLVCQPQPQNKDHLAAVELSHARLGLRTTKADSQMAQTCHLFEPHRPGIKAYGLEDQESFPKHPQGKLRRFGSHELHSNLGDPHSFRALKTRGL